MNSVKNLHGRARKRLGEGAANILSVAMATVLFALTMVAMVYIVSPPEAEAGPTVLATDVAGLLKTNDYALSSTSNVFYIAANTTTNITTTNANRVSILGAIAMSFQVDLIGTNAAGGTNNGRIQFALSPSLDGTLVNSASLSPTADVPGNGTTRVTWSTNWTGTTILQQFGAADSVLLTQIANTNLGGYFMTNAILRVIKQTFY